MVDTILQAFQICAASQGCMNNITIGDLRFGYYETVAGGSGAVSIALIDSFSLEIIKLFERAQHGMVLVECTLI